MDQTALRAALLAAVPTDGAAIGNQSLLEKLRGHHPQLTEDAYMLCRQRAFHDHAIQSMSGTSGRQRVQNDVLGRYLIVVPSHEVASEFGKIVTQIQKKIAANHSLEDTLAKTRDALLPRLIAGQLGVAEAPELLEEAEA